jgi:hypothetical protein
MGTIIPFPQPEPPDRKKWEDLWLSPSDESLIQEVIDRFGHTREQAIKTLIEDGGL